MNFENWVTGTFASASLNEAVSHLSTQTLHKMHKALHTTDSLLNGETVVAVAPGRFSGFGDSLLVITGQRLLLVKNTFQAGQYVELNRQEVGEVRFSHLPLMGNTLSLQGGRYKVSRLPEDSLEVLHQVFATSEAFGSLAQVA